MRTDPKFHRSAEAVDADYKVFGFPKGRTSGRIALGYALSHRLREARRLGRREEMVNGQTVIHPPMTHREFAKTNQQFQVDCENAGLPATPRQASKWRRQEGLAYTMAQSAKKAA